ncbi:MAG: hypothetical protein K5930_05115 [Treponemataceae bacterium]|nr:hypothetical protein [Treponemataceae bacterium]
MDATSPAAQVIISLIPIVGIGIGGVVVFFYLLWRHRQISLLIKAGEFKPARIDLNVTSMLLGILLTGIGFVLSILFILIDGLSYALLGGLIPLVMGIGFLVFYKVFSSLKNKDERQ